MKKQPEIDWGGASWTIVFALLPYILAGVVVGMAILLLKIAILRKLRKR